MTHIERGSETGHGQRAQSALSPKITGVTVELLRYVLDKPVGGSGVGSVDVIAVDLSTDVGLVGTGFSYVLAGSGDGAARAAKRIGDGLLDGPLLHPEVHHRRVRASFNRTGRGPLYIGLAAVDVACWDLYAKALGVPLGVAIGGEPRPVPVYGSGGLFAGQDPAEAAAQCRSYLSRGVRAVKPRVSGRPSDASLVRAVCDEVGREAFVAVDANEKCTASTAQWLLNVARDCGLLFVEEPLPARDLAGYEMLSPSGVAIATGEHLQGLDEALPFMTAGLCRTIQPDLAMMGGLTECIRVARVAEALGIEVAPHFLPNLFVHLATACPNVTWLEDFPLLEPLLGSPSAFGADGMLRPPEAPGHGLSWTERVRSGLRVPYT